MSKLSLKVLKIFLSLLFIIIASLALSYYYSFNSAFNDLKSDVKSKAAKYVQTVDGNKVEEIIKSKDKENKNIKEILDNMLVFEARNNISNLYILAKDSENKTAFIVDASPEPAEFMEKYDLIDSMVPAFNGVVSSDSKPTTDKWGTYLSGFAPIKNSSGQVVAIVGSDKDVGTFMKIKNKLFVMTSLVLFLVIAACFGIMYMFSKKLQKNMLLIETALDEISKGNLTENPKVKSKDEIEVISELIDMVRIKLSTIIGNVKSNVKEASNDSKSLYLISDQIAKASETVAIAVQNLSADNNSQLTDLRNMNSVFGNLTKEIEDISAIMVKVSSNVVIVNKNANESNKEMDTFIHLIKEVTTDFEKVATKVKSLGMKVQKIGEITSLINEVGEQTNLLALNAAIEAARAGEAGKGFAVVADEIRALSEKSRESLSDINEILKTISLESDAMVDTTQSVNNKLSNQIHIILSTTQSFKEIIVAIEGLLPEVDYATESIKMITIEERNIQDKLENFSLFSEKVADSVGDIASVAEELNASTEEVAASAKNLTTRMDGIEKSTNEFRFTETSA